MGLESFFETVYMHFLLSGQLVVALADGHPVRPLTTYEIWDGFLVFRSQSDDLDVSAAYMYVHAGGLNSYAVLMAMKPEIFLAILGRYYSAASLCPHSPHRFKVPSLRIDVLTANLDRSSVCQD
jgi:hypothetical protein